MNPTGKNHGAREVAFYVQLLELAPVHYSDWVAPQDQPV
jgi:hypothetical protein